MRARERRGWISNPNSNPNPHARKAREEAEAVLVVLQEAIERGKGYEDSLELDYMDPYTDPYLIVLTRRLRE